MKTIKNRMLALAFCIAPIFCFAQQNRSAVCILGELKSDSLLPYIDSLEMDCSSGDLLKFKASSSKLNSLNCLILKGDASPEEWNELFSVIKTRSLIKTIVFDENTFCCLPYGYEKLYNIEQLTFSNNEEMDYFKTFSQLAELPNLRALTLGVSSIFDLPDSLSQLKNVNKISLVNTNETFSENDIPFAFSNPETTTYDYQINSGNHGVSLKYVTSENGIDPDEYKELCRRFNPGNNNVSASVKQADGIFIPTYNYVKPPIKGVDVDRNFYTINSGMDNVLLYSSGTKILIPANSFIDKSGKPVTGSITLSYREFRDPVDFLVSGIPMKYDSNGVVNNFESAGMFEINASIKDQPLALAPGKKIDVNFVSTSVDSTYNFYAFNDSTGNWDYKTKPKTVTRQSTISLPGFTQAYYSFQSFIRNPRRVKDKTLFNNRFESSDYIYTSRLDSPGIKGHAVAYRSGNKTRYKSMGSLLKIARVKRTKDGGVLFKLRFMNEAHPEMNEFSNYYFATNDRTSVSDFKKQFVYKKAYNDIRLNSDGNDFELRLKGNKEIKNIPVHLVLLDNTGKVKEIKNVEAVAKRYNRRLKTRERIFNRNVKKEKIEGDYIELTNPDDIRLDAFKNCRNVMTASEKKMNYNEWQTYTAQLLEQQKMENAKLKAMLSSAGATANNLVQSLSLDGMGIYNCDQIQRLKEPVEIFARYRNTTSEKLSPSSTYIIDKRVNAVFQYDGYRGYNVNKIAFSKSKNAQNVMITVNADGTMAIYNSDEFRKNIFKNKSRFEFAVTEIDSKITSVSDLKKMIGL